MCFCVCHKNPYSPLTLKLHDTQELKILKLAHLKPGLCLRRYEHKKVLFAVQFSVRGNKNESDIVWNISSYDFSSNIPGQLPNKANLIHIMVRLLGWKK